MDKVMTFLTKYKNFFLAGIVILLLLGIFVGGFMAGKGKQKAEDLKAQEKVLTNDIKNQQAIVNSSTKSANELIDSAGIYESFARNQAFVIANNNIKIKNVKNDTKTHINNIDVLSNDSNVHLFSGLAQEYIDASK